MLVRYSGVSGRLARAVCRQRRAGVVAIGVATRPSTFPGLDLHQLADCGYQTGARKPQSDSADRWPVSSDAARPEGRPLRVTHSYDKINQMNLQLRLLPASLRQLNVMCGSAATNVATVSTQATRSVTKVAPNVYVMYPRFGRQAQVPAGRFYLVETRGLSDRWGKRKLVSWGRFGDWWNLT